MVCKECGSIIEKNTLFCGGCGTKVEDSPDKCLKCGDLLNPGAKFCRSCGEPLDEKLEDEVAVASEITEIIDIDKPRKNKNVQNILVWVISLTIVIAIFMAVGRKPKGYLKKAEIFIFEKDNDKIYVKSSGKEPYRLKSYTVDDVLVSSDGKKIYSVDEDGNLYLQEGGQVEKISSDVEWISMNPSGDTILYIKDFDNYNKTGALYSYTKKYGSEKITSEDCIIDTIKISDNGKYIAYNKAEDIYDKDEIRAYLYPLGKESIRVSKQIVLGVSNNGDILSTNYEGDLYITQKDQDSDKITSGMKTLVVNKDFSKILILDNYGNLYAYSGKETEKVESNIDYIKLVRGCIKYEEDILAIYYTDTKDLDVEFYKNDSVYVRFDGSESEKLGYSKPNLFKSSEDLRSFAYVNDRGLYLKKFKGGKLKEDKIESIASNFDISKNGKHIAYIKDGSLYYVPKGKIEGIKVDTKDRVINLNIKDDGTIYYKTDDGRLFISKMGKDSLKICNDVKYFNINDNTDYVVDTDDRLYEILGDKVLNKVSDDVTDIKYDLFIDYKMYIY